MKATVRQMTDEEESYLQTLLDAHPSRSRTLRMAAGNAAVIWCGSMLCGSLIWLACAWLASKLFNVDIGLTNSFVAVPLVVVLGIACMVFAFVSTVRWVRGWYDITESVQDDLAAQIVHVEEYVFCDSIRMQEPEHNGLIYFLREDDDSTFVYYDRESQDLAMQGSDALNSVFSAKTHLQLIRAPSSRVAIVSQFSGQSLDSGIPVELGLSPEDWPKHEEVCPVVWSEVMSTYALTSQPQ